MDSYTVKRNAKALILTANEADYKDVESVSSDSLSLSAVHR